MLLAAERALLLAGVATLSLLLAACTSDPPRRVNNICAIFLEKDDWYESARNSEQRWGTPVPVMMAIIRHESAFRADARPPRKRFLWIFPGSRPSSAYGYPQALDGTWEGYRKLTGNGGADRDDFADAIDFVGWYNHRSFSNNGIAKNDAYNLYLNYYLGHAGYRKGRHRSQPWLTGVAQRVADTAANYSSQLASCETAIKPRGWWPFS